MKDDVFEYVKVLLKIRVYKVASIMKILHFVSIFAIVLNVLWSYEVCPRNDTTMTITSLRSQRTLSRKKRYLAFPKGSVFVITSSILKALPIKLPTNWNLDFEFEVVWPIPSQEDLRKLDRNAIKKFQRPYLPHHRRHRRDLYSNFELALDSQGLPGKECILRTICEAKSTLNPPGVSLTEDLLRVILSNFARSKHEMDEYDIAYRTKKDCDLVYPCPLSILDLLLNFEAQTTYH